MRRTTRSHLGPIALVVVMTASLSTATAGQAAGSGKQIFESHRAVCHGADGRGDGPAAKGLDPRPADLASNQTQSQSEAQLRAVVWNGIKGSAMTAWKGVLSKQRIAEVVGSIKTLAPRAAVRRAVTWRQPSRAS